MKRSITLLLFLITMSLSAEEAQKPLLWPIEIGDMLFTNMETALTDETRTRGLMFRASLPYDGGMLFLFKKPEKHSFWMRNTLIPLDILFIDMDGKITAIHTMKAEKPRAENESEEDYIERLPSYPSKAPVIAAIELNAGMAEALGLKVGAKVEIFREELAKHLK